MAFFGLSGEECYNRIGSAYCAPSTHWNGSRYQSLNLTNVGRSSKNTIEIRCFAGTLDMAKIITAVYMSVALVARSVERSVNPRRITDPYRAADAFCRHNLADRTFYIVPEEPATDVTRTLRAAAAAATAYRERMLQTFAA